MQGVFTEMVDTVFLFIHQHYGEFGAVLDQYGINYTQYVALITVYMNVTLSEGDLARMMFLNPSTVSRMVYSLEKKDWIRSERDKDDRRKVMVSLSAAGKRRMEKMRTEQAEVIARQVAGLEEKKREFILGVAGDVNQALRYMIERERQGEEGDGN